MTAPRKTAAPPRKPQAPRRPLEYPALPPTERVPITPLLRFLRALDTPQKKQFAETCGTTLFYLYQLAADENPNPRLRLAKSISEVSRVFGKLVMTSPLSLDDLLIGQSRNEDDDAA